MGGSVHCYVPFRDCLKMTDLNVYDWRTATYLFFHLIRCRLVSDALLAQRCISTTNCQFVNFN